MMLELKVALPLLTPKGKALCHYIIDYGIEHHLMFVCFLDETGECWTFSNTEIRIENNQTIGRQVSPSKPVLPSQPHQSQSPPPQSKILPQADPYLESMLCMIAEKYPPIKSE